MADYDAIRRTIDANIYANGEQKITGEILNDILNEMVDVQEEFNGEIDNLVENYPNITINGDVTNAPDEEDITSDANNRLKLANRPAIDGMGYVILRKNKTFAEQVTLQNTIYEIRYNFDLGGASVTIPKGCVLKFEGGKLNNGTVVGVHTAIDAESVWIFGTDISLSGEWDINDGHPEWFGAYGDGVHDDSASFTKALQVSSVLQLLSGVTYVVNSTINVPYNSAVIGGYNSVIKSTTQSTISLFNLGYAAQVRNLGIDLDNIRNVFHIDSGYVRSSYHAHDDSAEAYKYETSANIRVSNISIMCKETENSNLNCIESFADGNGVGFWQVFFENITIYGRFKYAICLDNGNASGTSSPDWQTDLAFRNIKIGASINGIYIGKNDVASVGQGSAPERVLFDNVSMQYQSLTESPKFAVIEAGNRIIFQNCEPWDWVGKPFDINIEKASGITITNNFSNFGLLRADFSGNVSSSPVPIFKDAANDTADYELASIFPASRVSQGKITCKELTMLPVGFYNIPADTSWATFLGATQGVKIGQNNGVLRISRNVKNTTLAEIFTFPNYTSDDTMSGKKRVADYAYSYCFINQSMRGSTNTIPKWCHMQSFIELFDNLTNFLDTSNYVYLRKGFIGGQYDAGNNAPRFAIKVGDNIALDALGFTFTDRIGSSVPAVNNTYDGGKMFFLTGQKKPVFYYSNAWYDALGNPYDAAKSGATANRPTGVVAGTIFFDTTLGKPIWYNGSGWVDATGASV